MEKLREVLTPGIEYDDVSALRLCLLVRILTWTILCLHSGAVMRPISGVKMSTQKSWNLRWPITTPEETPSCLICTTTTTITNRAHHTKTSLSITTAIYTSMPNSTTELGSEHR